MMKTFILTLSTLALASCSFSGAYKTASQQFDFAGTIGKENENVYVIPVEEESKK